MVEVPHIQVGGWVVCFIGFVCLFLIECGIAMKFCLRFFTGVFSFQYFNTLENSLVNLFVLLTTSK